MITLIATAFFGAGIIGLFVLDRDSEARTSKALWIPVMWMLIAGSRNAGEWVGILQAGTTRAITEGGSYLQGNLIDQVVLGGLLALGVTVLFGRHKKAGELIIANAPVFMYLIYCCVSILWSDYPAVVFRRWNRALGDFVMVMVVLTDPNGLAALKRFIARAGFILLPLSLLFIRYYPELGRSYGVDGTPFWGGVTGNKNSLGMICLIFGLGSAWRFLTAYRSRKAQDRKRRLVVHGVIFVTAVWLIHTVNSATSLACVVLASVVMALTSEAARPRKPAFIHCLVVAVVSVSVFALFFDSSGDLVGTLGRNATLTGRTDIWKRALGLAKNPMLGTGFETFWLGNRLQWMRMLDPGLNHAHDGYVEVYLNLGLVGVSLIAAILAKGYRNIVSSLHRDPQLNSIRLAFFVVAVIYNCTESAFKMTSPIWILTLLMLMVVPKGTNPSEKQPTPILEGFHPLATEFAHNHAEYVSE